MKILLPLFIVICIVMIVKKNRGQQEVQIYYEDEEEVERKLRVIRKYNTEAGYWRDDL